MKKVLIIAGSFLIMGWAGSSFLDFHSISSNMKPLSAVGFVLTPIILLMLGKKAIALNAAQASIITFLSSFMFMASLFIMFAYGYNASVDGHTEIKVDLLPSKASAACFAIFCLYSFIYVYGHSKRKKLLLDGITLLIVIPSALALLGYLLDSQALRFYINDQDKGMTLQAAILFTLQSSLMFLKTREVYGN